MYLTIVKHILQLVKFTVLYVNAFLLTFLSRFLNRALQDLGQSGITSVTCITHPAAHTEYTVPIANSNKNSTTDRLPQIENTSKN